MAVRDPYFWKRFSAAVHASEAEEKAAAQAAVAASSGDSESGCSGESSKSESESGTSKKSSGRKSVFRRGKVERTASWLEREHAKKARRTLICWLFWFLFAALVGGVVALLLVLRGQGFIK